MIGNFRDKNNKVVEAQITKGRWEIVSVEKQIVDVFRRNGEPKCKKAVGVIRVIDTLDNDAFKGEYHPCNYGAVDLWESMPDAKQLPVPEEKPEQPKKKQTKKS